MKFDSLLILTYGRTGSTLLLGILNSIPGVLIRGENMNICAGFSLAYNSLCQTLKEHKNDSSSSTDPFFGAFMLNEDVFLNDVRLALRNQLVPKDCENIQCWGFKEIRYTPPELRISGIVNMMGYLDFLEKLMPRPAFIFLTRDHQKVSKSGFWSDQETINAIKWMSTFEEQASNWSKYRQNCFWIDYADLIGDRKNLKSLFNFLGAEYDDARILEVLGREHSYAGKAENLGNAIRTERKFMKLRIEVNSVPGMNIALIDHRPVWLAANTPFKIGGIMLPSEQASPIASLIVEGCDSAFVRTCLPSPRYFEKHPNNPYSATARFEITGLKLSGEQKLDIFVKFADQTKYQIARIMTE
ncbi:sulfotransferase [Nitrosomonas sp. Is37]|uniref:sulfotransferase n=1 Tax=Nitrosomonas sp. Is37 TaxID=3080535 RepID=UPI00294B0979|nr:sulfotransferase [Nitrosomonas sp. Is37]MDV6344326.1 sulfotransferase [Nitrosomonas sp. Is37]